jgi:phage regulator Rha-like protein
VVAQKFGKRHDNVTKAIKKILQDMSEIAENECKLIFEVTSQLVEQPNGGWLTRKLFRSGQNRKMWVISESGWLKTMGSNDFEKYSLKNASEYFR